MEQILGELRGWLTLYGLQVVGALAILVLGIIAAKALAGITKRLMQKAGIEETLVSFGSKVIKAVLIAIVIIAALNQVGFATTSLIAVLGAAGLAVGLALQSQLSSLAAGVLILLFRPFKLGDVINAGGALGTVEAIGLLTTHLKTPDGLAVVIPNTKVIGDNITNYNQEDVRRVDLVIGVGYEDDLLKAKNLLVEILGSHPLVLSDPAPQVSVMNLGESSVDFAVRPWVKRDDYWTVRFELTEQVKLRLDQAGINIPYPQRDVHLHAVQSDAEPVAAVSLGPA
ncbi:MAG: mechanosensitive ion channel [Desulfarculaceae bacterium]|jgi:small conductance mechanosensitive channel